MIVLEGTSSSDGVLDGELIEKGAFHGGVRDIFCQIDGLTMRVRSMRNFHQ